MDAELPEIDRRLSRQEAHDLGMIIKERAKVLRAHAEEQAAVLEAEFERQMAAIYDFDHDATWKAATEAAVKACKEAQKVIDKRCAALGIPKPFAPSISATWQGRGENALNTRRGELRRVAKTAIAAKVKVAVTRIEKQALDLRTQVVAMGLLSEEARGFLQSMQPVEEAMGLLDFKEIEKRLDAMPFQQRHALR